MLLKWPARNVSLALTITSILLGVVNILLGRRMNYYQHLPLFNSLAAAVLVLVGAALVFAFAALVRNRGRGASQWVAAGLAIVVLGGYLLDD